MVSILFKNPQFIQSESETRTKPLKSVLETKINLQYYNSRFWIVGSGNMSFPGHLGKKKMFDSGRFLHVSMWVNEANSGSSARCSSTPDAIV